MIKTLPYIAVMLGSFLVTSGCKTSGGRKSQDEAVRTVPNTQDDTDGTGSNSPGWIRVSDPERRSFPPRYGTRNVSSPDNYPGGRAGAASWLDEAGHLWIFGGFGFAEDGEGYLNDIWKFDGNHWTWIAGGKTMDAVSEFGTRGMPSANNFPGGRTGAFTWKDHSGELWLISGFGLENDQIIPIDDENERTETVSTVDQMWKFDGENWIWMAGGPLVQNEFEIEEGIAVPEAGPWAAQWTDRDGNLRIFGNGRPSIRNVWPNWIWKFDGETWEHIAGSLNWNHVQPGIYGEKGVPLSTNYPGGRVNASNWLDRDGNFWLFGGQGYGARSPYGRLNDLWKFDGNYWVWVAGDQSAQKHGIYGTKGQASTENTPGTRESAATWIDSEGNLWLFGGRGFGYWGDPGTLSDLWKFDGTHWTWIDGPNVPQEANPEPTPGPEFRTGAVTWTDSSGNLWLFGGKNTGNQVLNDLWKFGPK